MVHAENEPSCLPTESLVTYVTRNRSGTPTNGTPNLAFCHLENLRGDKDSKNSLHKKWILLCNNVFIESKATLEAIARIKAIQFDNSFVDLGLKSEHVPDVRNHGFPAELITKKLARRCRNGSGVLMFQVSQKRTEILKVSEHMREVFEFHHKVGNANDLTTRVRPSAESSRKLTKGGHKDAWKEMRHSGDTTTWDEILKF
jgi:hypothetical protein